MMHPCSWCGRKIPHKRDPICSRKCTVESKQVPLTGPERRTFQASICHHLGRSPGAKKCRNCDLEIAA